MRERDKKSPAQKYAIYGMIERNDNEFFAVCISVKEDASVTTSTWHGVHEAMRCLK
jgi:hypothetical protein